MNMFLAGCRCWMFNLRLRRAAGLTDTDSELIAAVVLRISRAWMMKQNWNMIWLDDKDSWFLVEVNFIATFKWPVKVIRKFPLRLLDCFSL
jgi:hypothetical protein